MWSTVIFLGCVLLFRVSVALSTEDEDLRAQFRAFEMRQRKSDAEIELLKTIAKGQRETIQAQQQTINNLERDVKALQKGAIQKSEPVVEGVSSSIQAQQRSGEKDGHQLRRISRATGGIAFAAYVDHTVDIGGHQTIKFNRILTNDGGAYNYHTGVFTCPQTGMYLFSFSVAVRGQHQIWAKLVVDNVNKVDAVAEARHDIQDIQGACTTVLHLTSDQSVWIQTYGDQYEIFNEAGTRLSTFTGVLLY